MFVYENITFHPNTNFCADVIRSFVREHSNKAYGSHYVFIFPLILVSRNFHSLFLGLTVEALTFMKSNAELSKRTKPTAKLAPQIVTGKEERP
jgi:dolichol kinase